jgi:RecB family endonuclease NucS
MISYSRQEIINTLNNAIEEEKFIYQLDCINYKGKTTDTKEKYTEVVAEYLLTNLDILNSNIKQITRENSYKTFSHDGKVKNESTSNRTEEITAKKMFNNSYSRIGKIIDYQIPLKNEQSDKAGKVDLISYDKEKNKLYLLELKVPKVKTDKESETLLRSVLEIYTYSIQVDNDKLLKDFNLHNASIQASVLHVEDNTAFDEYFNESSSIKVKKLMKALNVEFNYLDKEVYQSLSML